MASGRAADREDPKKSKRRAARSLDRDPISELHQGQRSDAPHPRAGHMTAPDHFAKIDLNILRRRGPFSNRSTHVKAAVYVARPGHGSLRGQPELPQHLVRSRSAGIARSTTSLRVIACPRPQPRNCLHPRPGATRLSCMPTDDDLDALCRHWLRGPAERFPGSPHAVQDNRQLARQRDTSLAGTGALLNSSGPGLQV